MNKHRFTLADADKLIATHTSDNMRDRVLAFIVAYQAEHTGNTPAVDIIARHLDTVPQAVQGMLKRLETERKIHIASRRPLTIVVMQRDTVLPHEGPVAPPYCDPERYSRLLEADGARHGLARWIDQHNEKLGRGPRLREAMDYLRMTNGGWVNRQLEILAERGLIQYGENKNTELTEAGKRFYGVAKPNRVVVPFIPKEKKMDYKQTVETRSYSGSTAQWVDKMGRAIYDFQQRNFGCSPQHTDIANAVGLSGRATIAAALLVMERGGLIKPRKKAGKRNIFLTEEGLARFAPQQEGPMHTVTHDFSEPDYSEPPQPEPDPNPTPPSPERPTTYGDITQPLLDYIARREKIDAAFPPASLSNVDTSDLIMELIERGYTVKR